MLVLILMGDCLRPSHVQRLFNLCHDNGPEEKIVFLNIIEKTFRKKGIFKGNARNVVHRKDCFESSNRSPKDNNLFNM